MQQRAQLAEQRAADLQAQLQRLSTDDALLPELRTSVRERIRLDQAEQQVERLQRELASAQQTTAALEAALAQQRDAISTGLR